MLCSKTSGGGAVRSLWYRLPCLKLCTYAPDCIGKYLFACIQICLCMQIDACERIYVSKIYSIWKMFTFASGQDAQRVSWSNNFINEEPDHVRLHHKLGREGGGG